MYKLYLFGIALIPAFIFVGCADEDAAVSEPTPLSWDIGDPTVTDYPEDYYAGGLLGTTSENSSTAFKQPSKAVVNADMMQAFN